MKAEDRERRLAILAGQLQRLVEAAAFDQGDIVGNAEEARAKRVAHELVVIRKKYSRGRGPDNSDALLFVFFLSAHIKPPS
jgi:hypothetical protein